jgi:outer membrane protein assembly factor BamE (lipoprotein component of BamABCDE complex)
MRFVRLLLLVAAVAILTGGCAFVRGTYGEEVKPLDISSIKKGISTRAEVATLLGAPERIVEVNKQEIFQYYHYDMKSGLLLFFSRTNVMSEDVFVFFDGNGIVQDIVVGKKKPDLEMQFWPFGD